MWVGPGREVVPVVSPTPPCPFWGLSSDQGTPGVSRAGGGRQGPDLQVAEGEDGGPRAGPQVGDVGVAPVAVVRLVPTEVEPVSTHTGRSPRRRRSFGILDGPPLPHPSDPRHTPPIPPPGPQTHPTHLTHPTPEPQTHPTHSTPRTQNVL